MTPPIRISNNIRTFRNFRKETRSFVYILKNGMYLQEVHRNMEQ